MAGPHLRIRWARLAALAALLGPASAAAEPPVAPARAPLAPRRPLILLPTLIADGLSLRRPRAADAELVPLCKSLDTLLTDTAQDLGLTVDLTPRATPAPARLGDAELLQQARRLGGSVVLTSLRILPSGSGQIELRVVVADPSARALHVRSERIPRDEIPVRAVVMLRDLTADLAASKRASSPAMPAVPTAPAAAPARSSGRVALLITTALFGGFAGYSIQRASGSNDPRVLLPLIAVGAGVGLGGSVLAAEEWDVGPGEAFYIAAGELWPTLAGQLIYAGRFSHRVETDRWVFGLAFGVSGLTLATLGLTLHGMSQGGALLAHSGGGFGMVLGGLTEVMVRGDIHTTPSSGLGFGAALGWLAASAAAIHVRTPPSRVLFVDLGALAGGLAGAAAGSPFLIRDPSAARQRAWAGFTAGGALIGATVALILTREKRPSSPAKEKRAGLLLAGTGAPALGVLGESTVGGQRAPILGVGWQGALF